MYNLKDLYQSIFLITTSQFVHIYDCNYFSIYVNYFLNWLPSSKNIYLKYIACKETAENPLALGSIKKIVCSPLSHVLAHGFKIESNISPQRLKEDTSVQKSLVKCLFHRTTRISSIFAGWGILNFLGRTLKQWRSKILKPENKKI